MANAAILWRNLADAGKVTATSSLVSTPVWRLQRPHTRVRWRSRSGTAAVILDLQDLVQLDTVALIATIATNCRLRISAEDPTGAAGELHDSEPLPVDQTVNQAVCCLPAPVTARYLRYDLSSSVLPYVAAGRLVAGLRSTFSATLSRGFGRLPIDRSTRTVSLGGQIAISQTEKLRSIRAPFDWITEAEADGFLAAMDREAGLSSDILFMLNPDPASPTLAYDTYWGLLTASTETTNRHFNIYSRVLEIEERP